jgi:hypothetical protein
LMEPPRISTTRMIANRSTTDSEMATTDHTLGRSALPARKRAHGHSSAASIVPPTPLWLLPGDEWNCRDRAILTPRVRGGGQGRRPARPGLRRGDGRQHGDIRGRRSKKPGTVIVSISTQVVHTRFHDLRCDEIHSIQPPGDMPHLRRINRAIGGGFR